MSDLNARDFKWGYEKVIESQKRHIESLEKAVAEHIGYLKHIDERSGGYGRSNMLKAIESAEGILKSK